MNVVACDEGLDERGVVGDVCDVDEGAEDQIPVGLPVGMLRLPAEVAGAYNRYSPTPDVLHTALRAVLPRGKLVRCTVSLQHSCGHRGQQPPWMAIQWYATITTI